MQIFEVAFLRYQCIGVVARLRGLDPICGIESTAGCRNFVSPSWWIQICWILVLGSFGDGVEFHYSAVC